jgi:hypothetical protein
MKKFEKFGKNLVYDRLGKIVLFEGWRQKINLIPGDVLPKIRKPREHFRATSG